MKKPLTLVGLGCGHRTRAYCEIAVQYPHRYRIVGAADPNSFRVQQIRELSRTPDFRSFSSDTELFAAGKIANVCMIGTQDSYHVAPALKAMELGYDVLLEKPISTDPREIQHLLTEAERMNRKVLVCHVLRYAPFYVKVKELLDSGVIGDIVSIDAREGTGTWLYAHGYVRGHWSEVGAGKSSPMLISKSCHDLDIISWLVNSPCTKVSSFGTLSHFTAAHAPEGAPARCTDSCPAGDRCYYNALNYIGRQRGWLPSVMDGEASASPDDIRKFLETSPWGRCVYRCNNNAVDHQVVSMNFEGGITGTFTMTPFDSGRDLIICGTKGALRGGNNIKAQSGHDIIVQMHSGNTTRYGVYADATGHGGGDGGLVQALDHELAKPAHEMHSGLFASCESHFIGYAAEESRKTGQTIDLAEYRRSLGVVKK